LAMSYNVAPPSGMSHSRTSACGVGYACRHDVTESAAPTKPEYDPADYPENNCPLFPQIIKRGMALGHEDRDAAFAYMEERINGDGIDINSKDRYGNTAVHYNYEFPEILAWLLAHGADIDAQNKDDWTAMHLACNDFDDRYKECLDMCERGADPNLQGRRGRTPLNLACAKHFKSGQSRANLIKMLLANGADPNKQWEEGTALHDVLVPSLNEPNPAEPDAMVAILDANCEINTRAESDGNTAFQRLVQMDGHGMDPTIAVQIGGYLLNCKADYTSPSGNGHPPRRNARSNEMRALFNMSKQGSGSGTAGMSTN